MTEQQQQDALSKDAETMFRWRAAHKIHQIEACDCGDGFGGCGTIGCFDCDEDWPCSGVLAELGGVDAAGYWRMQEAFFDAAMSEHVPVINEPDSGPDLPMGTRSEADHGGES